MLKTASVSMKDKELMKGPWEKQSVESQASLLHPMPLPLGGVVVLGDETLSYYNKEEKLSIDPPVLKQNLVSCVGKVDDWRCLLGDVQGNLYMLFVEKVEKMNEDKPMVNGLRLELLGEVGCVCVCVCLYVLQARLKSMRCVCVCVWQTNHTSKLASVCVYMYRRPDLRA